MNWIYILILFILSILIGLIIVNFNNKKLNKQKIIQYKLEQNKNKLDKYRKELINHFVHSSNLLNSMADEYYQLYQKMIEDPDIFFSEKQKKENNFQYKINKSKLSKNKKLSEIQSKSNLNYSKNYKKT